MGPSTRAGIDPSVPPPRRAETRGPPRSVRDAHELELLVVALDDGLLHLAQPRLVVLLLGLRLERAPLGGDEQALEAAVGHRRAAVEAENARLVQGLSRRVVLLPVGIADLWVSGHDDSGLPAAYPGQPRIARLHEAAMLLLERELAHVPDVPLLVLRVVVEGPLDRLAVLGHGVTHDDRLDALDRLRSVRHHLVVGLRGLALHAGVMERRARYEGQVA